MNAQPVEQNTYLAEEPAEGAKVLSLLDAHQEVRGDSRPRATC